MGAETYRKIPGSTKLSLLFGGFKSQFGWSFLGFGLIFFWAFAMNADLSYNNGKEMVTVEGIATGFVEIDASEGEVPVFENHYKFITDNGIEYEGVSYATGQRVLKGDTIAIEYPQGNPQKSKIKGMRRKIFSPIVMFVVIFPLVGLIFILLGLRRSIRALRLLKYGELTKGVLISKDRTNTRVNKRYVYKMTFRYEDDGGNEYEHIEKTSNPYFLQDQKEERLLYLRRKPAYATMLDSLPAAASITRYGRVESYPMIRVIFLMFIPLATILGHGIYFISTYVS